MEMKTMNKSMATCNPFSAKYYFCSNQEFCGDGPEFCTCDGCINYKFNGTSLLTKGDHDPRVLKLDLTEFRNELIYSQPYGQAFIC